MRAQRIQVSGFQRNQGTRKAHRRRVMQCEYQVLFVYLFNFFYQDSRSHRTTPASIVLCQDHSLLHCATSRAARTAPAQEHTDGEVSITTPWTAVFHLKKSK